MNVTIHSDRSQQSLNPVEKPPTVIDRWGDYHQKHYPKEGKKAAKCWQNPAAKGQPSCRIQVLPVNRCDLLLRQLKASKKKIIFVQWKIKDLLGCNKENSFDYSPGQGQT